MLYLGGFFGGIAYLILPKYRHVTLGNLRAVFSGKKSEKQIERVARDVFRNLGRTGAEVLSLRKLKNERIKELTPRKDVQLIQKLLSKGKGLIIISSHFGNWEMGPIVGAANGFDITVIGRRIYYPPYNNFLVSIRESGGVKTLYRDDRDVLRKSLQILKSNKILGIVPDQDVDSVDGVFVDFFGKPAYTPAGPAALAMLSGAPLLPSFTVRENDRLRVLTDEPIYVKQSGDRKKDIALYTQKWSRVVEKYIRKYPAQWVWMHKRWKTRPDDEHIPKH